MSVSSTAETRGRDQFHKYKRLIGLLTGICRRLPIGMRKRMLERRRNTRGKIGIGIRYALLKSIAIRCGDNVSIFQGVYVLNPQNLVVGSNVSIHPMTYLECGKGRDGGLIIGDDVSIAHGVTIMATTHTYASSDIPIKDQPVITKPVKIGANVWIGAKATVLAGITVGTGCVIGANAVLTKSTDANMVYAGIPARVVKERLT